MYNVYKKAAEGIADNKYDFCCEALYGSFPPKLKTVFLEMYKPENAKKDSAFFGSMYCVQTRMARSLALLLMYEMEKDKARVRSKKKRN